ncbi:hypothetical protein BD289DRAFT_46186 [Coniella lustricola]|uniref:Uncharacterized protein n=1 Tax=Coniella lustricola TaxID=2025994 RepID=A0A2T3AIB2_9PEZI|nr:hypothetical protein BD289DRAFT_46186 [Coniella lustricola]
MPKYVTGSVLKGSINNAQCTVSLLQSHRQSRGYYVLYFVRNRYILLVYCVIRTLKAELSNLYCALNDLMTARLNVGLPCQPADQHGEGDCFCNVLQISLGGDGIGCPGGASFGTGCSVLEGCFMFHCSNTQRPAAFLTKCVQPPASNTCAYAASRTRSIGSEAFISWSGRYKTLLCVQCVRLFVGHVGQVRRRRRRLFASVGCGWRTSRRRRGRSSLNQLLYH